MSKNYFDAMMANGANVRICRAGKRSAIRPNMVATMSAADEAGDRMLIEERGVDETVEALGNGTYTGGWIIVMRPDDYRALKKALARA